MKIIGHRGASGLAPDNTIESIKKALEVGADGVEVDVRVTRDGVAVLSHDPIPKKSSSTFTALSEAIATVNKRAPLMLEIKPKEPVEPIIKILENFFSRGWKPSDLMVSSFSYSILGKIRDLLPAADVIVLDRWSGIRAAHRAKKLGIRKICMDHKWLWGGFIAAMSRSGYELYTYTLNNPARARRLEKYGLAGVITDYPDRYKK